MTTNERDAFEAWALTSDGNCNDIDLKKRPESEWAEDGVYYHYYVDRAWLVWQAARAAPPAAPQVSDKCHGCDGHGDYEHKGATVVCRVCDGTGVAPSPQPEQTALKRLQAWRDGAGTQELDSIGGVGYSPGNATFADDVIWLMAAYKAKTAPPLSLPAEYAAAVATLKEIGYAWVATDHGMSWYRKELSDADICAIAGNPICCPCSPWWLKDDVVLGDVRQAAISFARAVLLAAAKGEQS